MRVYALVGVLELCADRHDCGNMMIDKIESYEPYCDGSERVSKRFRGVSRAAERVLKGDDVAANVYFGRIFVFYN